MSVPRTKLSNKLAENVVVFFFFFKKSTFWSTLLTYAFPSSFSHILAHIYIQNVARPTALNMFSIPWRCVSPGIDFLDISCPNRLTHFVWRSIQIPLFSPFNICTCNFSLSLFDLIFSFQTAAKRRALQTRRRKHVVDRALYWLTCYYLLSLSFLPLFSCWLSSHANRWFPRIGIGSTEALCHKAHYYKSHVGVNRIQWRFCLLCFGNISLIA